MTEKKQLYNRIEKTMGLLDDEVPIKADPYFFTRLKARMNSEETVIVRHSIWHNWRSLALFTLAAVNLVTGIFVFSGRQSTYKRQESLEMIALDYKLDSASGDWFSESMGE